MHDSYHHSNQLLADIHDRMPVILPPDLYQHWLDPKEQNVGTAVAMLQPLDPKRMRRHAVSARVNHEANDGPECCVEVDLAKAPAAAPNLFD